jgi:hypothetical protein
MVRVSDVLKAISDEISLDLFRIVILTKPNTEILISKTKLTRKQYYSRMSTLMKVGLINRINGKYILTAFGKLIYYKALIIMENATSSYWELKAIDSLEMSNDLPAEERKNMINSLVDNEEIKVMLLSDNEFDSKSSVSARAQQQKHLPQLKERLLVRQRDDICIHR